ncbi:cation:proton antiporter [Thermocrinis minervae]|uniref:Transporter, CPA2 family n=1 Tax=Thermocrinis minervae TaxID=381751 RepID=A0A1M6TDG8_9AQUI|nr:cation:proton antiporter [Thermocrinis minervae]SHK54929.1 transporter, CPA2 family [Thermocrinis minervae]
MHELFLQLAIILFTARLVGDLFAKFGIPTVLGEILVGVLLGQSALGLIPINDVIRTLAEIGILVLLFHIGLEADIHQLKKVGLSAFFVATVGALTPIFLSTAVGIYVLDLPLTTSLFLGGTFTATSIGITVGVLKSLGRLKERFAQVVLGAAVIDDVLGIIALTVIAQYARNMWIDFNAITTLILYIAIFFFFSPLLAKIMANFIQIIARRLGTMDFVPSTVMAMVFFFAYLSHLFQMEAILGAFTAGLALSRNFSLPFANILRTDEHMAQKIEHTMAPLTWLFTPIFFVYVGLQINLRVVDLTNPTFWKLFFILLFISFVGKLVSGFVTRGPLREKLLIGLSMLPRGEVGLIFVELGKQLRVYDEFMYAVVVGVVAVTTLLSPILLKLALR